MKKNILVLSSPSGGGKSTVAKFILENFKNFTFSISATTRQPRPGELHDIHYCFLSRDEFRKKIEENELIEYEEIFGNYYGTLKSTTNSILDSGKYLLFDVDVKGALSIKKHFPDTSVLLFIAPPSMEVLETRLRNRNTENEEQLQKRLERSRDEMEYIGLFDRQIINNELDETLSVVETIISQEFL